MNYCNREFTYYDIGQTFCTCQQGYYSSSGTDIEGCIKCPLSTTSASVGGKKFLLYKKNNLSNIYSQGLHATTATSAIIQLMVSLAQDV